MSNPWDAWRIDACRVCGGKELTKLFSLGVQSVSDFVAADKINQGVKCPIELVLCQGCGLVQQRYTAPQDFMYSRHYWYKCIGASEKIFARVNSYGKGYGRDCLLYDTAEKILSLPHDISLPCVQRDGTVQWRQVLHRKVSVQPVYVIEFFTGARVVASADHRWPILDHGMKWRSDRATAYLRPKDRVPLVLDMPRPDDVVDHDSIYDSEAGYLIGVYLAEGYKDQSGLRLSLHHEKDKPLMARVKSYVTGKLYDAYSSNLRTGQAGIEVHLSGFMVVALIDKFVRGTRSSGKRLDDAAWCQPVEFLRGIVDGWLDGDGHYETDQDRWRFNICQNTDLVEDMDLACRLVGYRMRYRLRRGTGFRKDGSEQNQYAGWVRKSDDRMRQHQRMGRLGCTSVKRVWRQKGPKRTWDVAVGGDELYSLGCGIVTHNSGTTKTMRDALREVTAAVEGRLDLKAGDVVLDIGANDGTLLRSWAVDGLCRVGVEPATNLAGKTNDCGSPEYQNYGQHGIDVINDFWSADAWLNWFNNRSGDYCNDCTDAHEGKARAITALGMFYDLPNPNQFIADVAKVLRPDGMFVAQLMCLRQTLDLGDVGNLVHEHLEFYSLRSLKALYERHGLEIFDVEENSVNGGSYRVWARLKENTLPPKPKGCVQRMQSAERWETGYDDLRTYVRFHEQAERNRDECVNFVHRARVEGKRIWWYGASTKSAVLTQWYGLTGPCGVCERTGMVTEDSGGVTPWGAGIDVSRTCEACHGTGGLIEAAADKSAEKVGKFMVGSGIPIKSCEDFRAAKPDYAVVGPYAFLREFMEVERQWLRDGGRFLVPLPNFKVVGL